MNLKTAEEFRMSEAALDFAQRCVADPVFRRNIIFAVWQTRGYNIIGGVPVPIGENVVTKMGADNEEWQQKYRAAFDAEVQKLFDEENNGLEQEKQHEAAQQADDECYDQFDTGAPAHEPEE